MYSESLKPSPIHNLKLTKSALNLLSYKNNSDYEKDDLLNRYKILIGEIDAGNNNPNIIKELKKILLKMKNKRMISDYDFNESLFNLIYIV